MVNALAPAFWSGRRVFVTGHSGFKGGWLVAWLHALGAEVHGYALEPPTRPSLFDALQIGGLAASSTVGDVRDIDRLRASMARARPDVVLHLAAQPLVRESYARPLDTYAVNVMGTVHLLDAVRTTPTVKVVVNVTTDKCYENREWPWPYRECEPMGGHDPYSSSKGCAELVTAAYRRSFLAERGVAVATARAGNVVGGGDWAADRLVPDVLRALDADAELVIRAPAAIRPWQHVLEAVSGYLTLAERLHGDGELFAEPWNFGPADDDARSVEWILGRVASRCPGLRWTCETSAQPHEASWLKLDSNKARARLGWAPRWRVGEAIDRTIEWHTAWRQHADMRALTLAQIEAYLSTGEAARVSI